MTIYKHEIKSNTDRKQRGETGFSDLKTNCTVDLQLAAMTSKKHRQFCLEPMGDKPVHDLPGIDRALGGRLQNSGIRHARDIEGHFLVFNQNQEKFGNWLRDTCGANAKQQRDCYNGVREWTKNNL